MNYLKNTILALAASSLLIIPSISIGSVINENESIEIEGISFRGLKICHQNEWRHLTVDLEYSIDTENNNTDIQSVKNHVKKFLEEYSNPEDFWEIMNTKLVWSLADTFPNIRMMASSLSLNPDRTLKFPRRSIIKYEKGSDVLKESFQFTKLNYLICQKTFQTLDLHVTWDLKDNPDPTKDYPDYQWVDNEMDIFFKKYPISITEWKTLKPALQFHLLEKFPSLASINIEINVVK